MTKNEELMNAILGDPDDEDGNEDDGDNYEEEEDKDQEEGQTQQNEKFLDNMRMLDDEEDSINEGNQHLKTVKEIPTEDATQHQTQDLK
jgi:hypothetical protein